MVMGVRVNCVGDVDWKAGQSGVRIVTEDKCSVGNVRWWSMHETLCIA